MKILVVDDEQDVRLLFEQRFRKEIRSGIFDFAFCYSGEDALDFYKEHPGGVILILSDINMPGMSGLDLLRLIREKAPEAPPFVVMITAYGDAWKQAEANRLGANDFLQKPLDFNALSQKITVVSSY
jgi:CheY-like chemotaxis protein